MNRHHQAKAAVKTAPLMAFVALLAGCASSGQINTAKTIPVPQWLNTKNTVTFLSDQHSQQIDNARTGETVKLGASPWGENAQLRVGERYFSATGKSCFITSIVGSERNLPATVCEYPEGNWGVTRSYTAEQKAVQDQEIGGVQ
ncbi:DVU3141 family protein [Marinobacter nauticus]|uniref:DVU3141 family protein n=1 Tax=Marinobacter nauticus TaxID=2743 RepID=UPI003516D750